MRKTRNKCETANANADTDCEKEKQAMDKLERKWIRTVFVCVSLLLSTTHISLKVLSKTDK